MIQITTPGLYRAADLPMADYLADPCPVPSLSSGAAHRLLTRSPRHVFAHHPRLGGAHVETDPSEVENDDDGGDEEREENDHEKVTAGTVAHEYILGGEGKIKVFNRADYRSKPNKEFPEGKIPLGWTNKAIRDARKQAISDGLLPILPKTHNTATAMVRAMREFIDDSRIAGAFDSGEGESTIIALIDGVWVRTRPDWINWDMRLVMHLKTTKASANPDSFIPRIMKPMGYDVSLSMYRLAFELSGLESAAQDFQHMLVVQEQDDPWCCSLISMDPEDWAIADSKVQRAMALWKRCLMTNRWPAYSGEIHYSTPRPWELAQAEEAAQADGFES